MAAKDKQENSKNQGEGDKEAARNYNEDAEAFAKSGKVADKADERRHPDDIAALRKAEAQGRARAKETDPNVTDSQDSL